MNEKKPASLEELVLTKAYGLSDEKFLPAGTAVSICGVYTASLLDPLGLN